MICLTTEVPTIVRRLCPPLALALLLCLASTLALATPQTITRGDHSIVVDPELPSWVDDRPLAGQWAQQAPLRYWLLDSQVDRRAGQQWRYFDYALEVGSAELLSDAGRIELGYQPEYERLSLHRIAIRRDGRWLDRLDPEALQLTPRKSQFEQNIDSSEVSVLLVVDDLRVGDVLRVSASVQGHNPVLGDLRSYLAVTRLPVPAQYVRHRLWFDPGSELARRSRGAAPAEQLESLPNALQWQVVAEDQPALLEESQTPAGYETWEGWQIAPQRSWADVVAWALPLYTPPSRPLPAELQAEQARLAAIDDPAERAAAALSLVQEQVRYVSILLGDSTHKPAAPELTWQRRWGDCKDKSLLLAALLQAVDIDAVPALVSIEHDRYLSAQLPAANVFDHAIVRVRIDGEDYWVDPTDVGQKGPLATRHAGLLGQALPIAAGVDALLPMQPSEQWAFRANALEHFTPPVQGDPFSADWTLTVTTEHWGPSAQNLRSLISSQGLAQLEQSYLEFYGRQYAGLSRLSPVEIRDDDDSGRLTVIERYQLKMPLVRRQGGSYSLEPMVLGIPDVLSLPPGDRRKLPLGLNHPMQLSYAARLDLPEGWRWQDESVAGEFGSKGFRYRYSLDLEGKQLEQRHRVESLQAELAAADVPEHFSAVQEAREHLGLRMRVVAKDADQAVDTPEERRRRAMEALLKARD